MKAPDFWAANTRSVLPILLSPLSYIYRLVDYVNRGRVIPEQVDVPVICVGNVVAGGAGKTPVAISIAQFLLNAGWKVHFLSRGYGGQKKELIRVVQDVHSANEVGDEPLLLASVAPTWVSKDRVKAARSAIEAGAEILIMDDGFQNPALVKDLSVLVVDGGYGFGNGYVIPAGPLRETPQSAFSRCDAIVNIGEQATGGSVQDLPIFSAKIVPHELQAELVGEKVVAFAGIGRPDKFFDTLHNVGAEIVEAVSFPDHYSYKQEDIMELVEKAAMLEAALVTTRKDYVRLPLDAQMMTTVFDIDLLFAEPREFQKLLMDKLGSREHA